jgi:hypothetical protein
VSCLGVHFALADGEMGNEDFAYTWDWFQGVRDLYLLAAAEGLFVLFTADQ